MIICYFASCFYPITVFFYLYVLLILESLSHAPEPQLLSTRVSPLLFTHPKQHCGITCEISVAVLP